MQIRPLAFLGLLALAACGEDPTTPAGPAGAGGAPAAGDAVPAELAKRSGEALEKGRAWLLSKRDEAGAWGKKGKMDTTVGYTALAVSAVIAATPREALASNPAITTALDYVAAAQKPDGAVFANPMVVNYETSAAVGAFAAARMAKYGSAQAKARDYLVGSQLAGDEASPAYGGFPYKPGTLDKPVDLSNLQFAVEALRDAGVPSDHVVFQRAMKYLARVQNRSETNPGSVTVTDGGESKEVVSSNDGGAVYAPGTSKAGLVKRPDGKFEARSYGSMTYALLKCLLLSGAKADDPRVVAAVGWLSNHFTLDRNPGFESDPKDPAKAGQQGYYYYLRTMSRALAEFEKATGKPLEVKDQNGAAHAWRKELIERVIALQKEDGSWVNDKAERWDEGDPVLASSYALEALAIARGR